MDEKQILMYFKSCKNNSGYESGQLNRTEIPSILQKNKRRSKKDKTGRNYVCGCGKTYLSYPALYTHIKNKHEGEHPPGTTLQPQSRVKPGRPPKRFDSLSKRDGMYNGGHGEGGGHGENGQGDEDDEDEDGMSQGMSDKGTRSPYMGEHTPNKFGLGELNNSYEKYKSYTFQKEMISEEDLGLVARVRCLKNSNEKTSPGKTFMKEKNFITNQFILHPVSQYINQMKEDFLPENFFQTLPTCDKLFALYLYNLSLNANQLYTDMVAVLLRGLRECLNQKGYDLLQTFETQNPMQKVELLKQTAKSQDFCQVEPTWYISVAFDYFVKEFLPKYLEDENNFSLPFVCLFLKDFNRWLLRHNLSRVKCSFFSFYM